MDAIKTLGPATPPHTTPPVSTLCGLYKQPRTSRANPVEHTFCLFRNLNGEAMEDERSEAAEDPGKHATDFCLCFFS